MESSNTTIYYRQDSLVINDYSHASEVAYEIQKAMHLYFLFPTAVVGIFCNILSIAVLSRDDVMNPTTSLLLRTLAAADTLNITFIFSTSAMQNLTGSDTYNKLVKPWLYYVCFPLQGVSFTASVWTAVLLTGERYAAICHPLHVGRISTVRRARAAVVSVWVVAILLNVCKYFEQRIHLNHDDDDDDDSGGTFTPWLADSQAYNITFNVLLFPVVSMLLPFALLVVFTSRMLAELRRSYREKLTLATTDEEKVKKLSSKQRRMTATTVLIVVVFSISQLAAFLNYTLFSIMSFTSPNTILRPINTGLLGFATSSGVVQSTLNFFVFCLTGQRFRQILREAMGCKEK